MHEALEPTRDPDWLLSHQGYNVLTESAVESSLAFGNGFLGMRAARSVSGGPTWVAWLGYSRGASWPRCYVAGLFDMPNTEPASAGAGACRRLVPRAHSAGRRAAIGARGRSAARHPPTRHAPRPAAVGVDASHPRRHHRDRAPTAFLVAGGPRGGAEISATRAGSRRHRREAGGQFRDGRPWHGAGAVGAGPWRLAHRGHAQGRGDDRRRDAAARW